MRRFLSALVPRAHRRLILVSFQRLTTLHAVWISIQGEQGLVGSRLATELGRAGLRDVAKVICASGFLAPSRWFLPLTRAFCSATNRRKTSSLVVSLLTELQSVIASGGRRPAWQGRPAELPKALSCNTPPTPGGENETVFTSFLFLGIAGRVHVTYFK